MTLAEAIVLVILVIFVFLQGWRSTLIPALTIPVSLIGTFAFVKLFGFSINTLTLFGITLATGLVVDDAIVVIENIERHMREEQAVRRTAPPSTRMREVSGAVIAISLVLVAVFVPVAFFPGTTGQLYRQFALTIAFSVALSTFSALTLTPALCGAAARRRATRARALLPQVDRVLDRGTERLRARCCARCCAGRALMLVFFALGLAAPAVWLFGTVPTGFIPDEDQGYFIIVDPGPRRRVARVHDARLRSRSRTILARSPRSAPYSRVGGFTFGGSRPRTAA